MLNWNFYQKFTNFSGVFCEDPPVPQTSTRLQNTETVGRIPFGNDIQYYCQGYETLLSDHSTNFITYTCLDSEDGDYDKDQGDFETCALSNFLTKFFFKSVNF